MTRVSRVCSTFLLALLLAGSAAQSASAISADLAKKCRDMMVKAYPPVVAGTRKGSAQAERQFYQDCIAKDGKVDASARGKAESPAAAPPPPPAPPPANR